MLILVKYEIKEYTFKSRVINKYKYGNNNKL